MHRNTWFTIALLWTLSLPLTGCGGEGPAPSGAESEPRLEVSAPTGPVVSAPSSAPVDAGASPAEGKGEAFSFADLRGWSFTFQSGAGAWGTTLSIQEDGSFEGEYSDSDMEVQYRCDFTGQFTQPVQVDDCTWSAEIAWMEYEKEAGTEEDGPDGIRCVYSEPYGLDGAERILIYLPGAPSEALPEDFVNWVTSSVLAQEGASSLSEVAGLPFYGLYNEAQGLGFSSYDLTAGLEDYVALAQERTEELEVQLQGDGSMSQGDINSAYGEIYNLWDSVLNRAWNVLMEILPQEEAGPLIQEELDWIRWKEEQMEQAGEEYGGGSLSVMAQAQRGAELTRARAEELMELLR